jgi:hypothetical protein
VDFQPDGHGHAFVPTPGKFLDILDFKLYNWPGHGVPKDTTYQCIEGEYMRADEYDVFIHNPLHFFYFTWPSRVFGALEPLATLPPLAGVTEMYTASIPFIPYGTPPVKATLQAMMDAGDEAVKWIEACMAFAGEITMEGFPSYVAGASKAPFDVIGDTLRGTKGVMMDMYRQPDKLLAAMEALTPMFIQLGVGAAKMNGCPLVFMPLHKGADGFMSDAQFERFYWPTLKAVMLGLIEEGCIPEMFAEGSYDQHLEIIGSFPFCVHENVTRINQRGGDM